jgi:tetratricopeptide (TPR) repeat protein
MSPEPPSEAGPRSTDDRNARWMLGDQRDFLQRSLDDAEREHDAGDLSDHDYRVLVARDRRKLEEVEAALAELGPDPAADPPPAVAGVDDDDASAKPARRSRRAEWRRVGIIACCFLIVAGTAILVDHALAPASPGQPVTGSIDSTLSKQQVIEQQLSEALTYNDENQDVAAMELFEKVLSEDPSDPKALAEAGWLEWKNGLADHDAKVTAAGRADVDKAVKVAPSFYEGHLYLALIEYYGDGNAPAAVAQFSKFLSEDPPEADVALVKTEIIAAYKQAGLPVPALPATTTTTTTTTTTKPATAGSATTTTTSTP